jgi:hypothetical protein
MTTIQMAENMRSDAQQEFNRRFHSSDISMPELDECNRDRLLRAASLRAIDVDEFTREMLDDHVGGNVHQWVVKNCKLRPGIEFFVTFLVCAEIADELARREGYANQFDRAAKLAFNRD